MGMYDTVHATGIRTFGAGATQPFWCPPNDRHAHSIWVGNTDMQTKCLSDDPPGNKYVIATHGLWLMEGAGAPIRILHTGNVELITQCPQCGRFVEFEMMLADGVVQSVTHIPATPRVHQELAGRTPQIQQGK